MSIAFRHQSTATLAAICFAMLASTAIAKSPVVPKAIADVLRWRV